MEEENPVEKTRRHYSPEQKVAILRQHLIEQVPVSELCEKHQIPPTLFYQWQNSFFENGAAAFERERPRSQSLGKEEDKINRLEAKLKDRDEALAELMQEHLRLKKELGEI
jgi:transposase-like protein